MQEKKERRQINKKFFEFKNVAYRDGIKSKETRQGWSSMCVAVAHCWMIDTGHNLHFHTTQQAPILPQSVWRLCNDL